MSADEASDERPAGALPRGYARREGVEPRPVWVLLSAIYPAEGDYPGPAEDTEFVGAHGRAPVPPGQHGRLDLSGEVLGRLHSWERDLSGHWYGLVDYSVPFVGDLRPAKRVNVGLVPAAALRPREPRNPDGQPRHAP